MLKKDRGSSRCHRLRIIALFENDLNQAKRLFIGQTLSHHLEDFQLLPNMQCGSRTGRQCQSDVLQKVLCHDMARITKLPTAFIENDAVGCYDRLVNNLILLLLAKLGFAHSVCSCLGVLWDSTTYFIKTLYGTSSVAYSSTAEVPLFGPGQGSNTGPPFWLIVFFAIVESLDPTIGRAFYRSVCRRLWVDSTGSAFIDDSSLGVTFNYIYDSALSIEHNASLEVESLMEKIRVLAQHWERLLFSTGGGGGN
jgi:hypothetical protein